MVPLFFSFVPIHSESFLIWTCNLYGDYKDQRQFYILLSKFNNKSIASYENEV